METASTELQKLLDGPAMAAPPGAHHNFVNPSNMKREFNLTLIICLIVSMLAVGMRMWTKTRVVRKVVLEDCNSFFSLNSLRFVD